MSCVARVARVIVVFSALKSEPKQESAHHGALLQASVMEPDVTDVTAALPCRELLDLPAVVLQCVAEFLVVRDYAAFAQTCSACHASSAGALHAVVANEVARRLNDGEKISDVLCQKCPNLEVPRGVSSIGRHAFEQCQSLTSIVLPAGLTEIGAAAFNLCFNLTSVVLPSSCKTIGGTAFCSCYALTSIILPSSLTKLGGKSFSSCKSLTAITIPDGVVILEQYTFEKCKALVSATLPANLTSIHDSPFENCTALKSIDLPRSVTFIQKLAFCGCAALDAPSRERIRAICPDAVI